MKPDLHLMNLSRQAESVIAVTSTAVPVVSQFAAMEVSVAVIGSSSAMTITAVM